MPGIQPHRKTVRHFPQPGDLHELTFSCYRRMKLLTNNPWRASLSLSIDEACPKAGCFLAAFVYMPEHVHLLVWGVKAKEQVSEFLSRVKQPVSWRRHEADCSSGCSFASAPAATFFAIGRKDQALTGTCSP